MVLGNGLAPMPSSDKEGAKGVLPPAKYDRLWLNVVAVSSKGRAVSCGWFGVIPATKPLNLGGSSTFTQTTLQEPTGPFCISGSKD